jgi:hypothetical protein
LRKQKELVVRKGKRMIEENLRDMDEVEEVERRESEAAAVVQATSAFDVSDWSAVDLFPVVDPLSVDQDVVDGTVGVAEESSGDS